MAFEQFKINSMSQKIHEATKDKYQLHLRYARRLYTIYDTRIQEKMAEIKKLKQAFHKLKTASILINSLNSIGSV